MERSFASSKSISGRQEEQGRPKSNLTEEIGPPQLGQEEAYIALTTTSAPSLDFLFLVSFSHYENILKGNCVVFRLHIKKDKDKL